MKILLIVAYFIPEIGSAAHVYFDLAKAFVRRGHQVDVITSYPRKFNLNKADADKEFPLEEVVDEVKIHRCKYDAKRDSIILRGLEHFLLPAYYFNTYRRLGKKFDGCLIYIPPLPLYYLAMKIKRYDGTPSVLNYQDFHPQELTDVGVLKNKPMIKIMEYIERSSYRNADYITVLSKGGIDYIAERGGDRSKIEHIFNGANPSDLAKCSTGPNFKKKEGIEDKFLISYAGILSPFQGIDNILNAAKKLRSHKDLIFYIIGDGIIKKQLEQRIKSEDISNVKLLPLQPRDEYYNIICSSDVSLVSLDDRMKAPCVPGKLINLLGIGKSILASIPLESETASLIKEVDCGIAVKPGDVEGLCNAVLSLKKDAAARDKFSRNGANFFRDKMDIEENIRKYEKIFRRLHDDSG